MSACAWMVGQLAKGILATPIAPGARRSVRNYSKPRASGARWLKKSTVVALRLIQSTPGIRVPVLAETLGTSEKATRALIYSIRRKKLVESKRITERTIGYKKAQTNAPVGFHITYAGILALDEYAEKEKSK